MPYVPGYQAVGQVIALGDSTSGAHVAVGELVACFTMGAHQRYVVADLALTHRVDRTDRSHTAALFVQPAVGANALNLAQVKSGDSVLIVGQGLIGQATAKLARLRGAYVIGTDLSPERLQISQTHCVDRIVDASIAPPSEQIADEFPAGVDIVIESTGFDDLVVEAIKCARKHGTMVFEGQYTGGITIPPSAAHAKYLTAVFPNFLGSPASRASVLRMLTDGTLDLLPLITHLTTWDSAVELYSRLFTAERDHINGIVFDWRTAA
jgi:2-desacetyl-2-hydroxyethyl bacteriochlorophyllide A dehydrogenase